ncbi:unnamed protein product [Sphenostylis stenocarpa]|uniref:Cytochrome c biogenesis FC n=1 Tax=Sphenostylis stenocarpa TaxID=92480 RepID=A0AA86TB35_9FABA|nr:unnamed protein product [Sphenostylis stenocarpa]
MAKDESGKEAKQFIITLLTPSSHQLSDEKELALCVLHKIGLRHQPIIAWEPYIDRAPWLKLCLVFLPNSPQDFGSVGFVQTIRLATSLTYTYKERKKEKEKKDSGQDGDASLSAIGCSSLARGLVFIAHHPTGIRPLLVFELVINGRLQLYPFAPLLLKWFISRDVPTGAPFSNGTIIPILIPSFPLLVYLHSRKFIRSMDGAKSGVLVKASRLILLPDIIGRSSSETRARNTSFHFVPVLHFLLLEFKGEFSYLESFCGVLYLLLFCTLFSLPRDRSAKRERAWRRKCQTLRPKPNGNEQQRNDKMGCFGHPNLERRVKGFGPVAFPVPPTSGGACVGGVPPEPEIGLEALALPTSQQLMVVGHDYHQKAPMKINISHFGVCICMLGVLLSCDPEAYVQPVAHASCLFVQGGRREL